MILWAAGYRIADRNLHRFTLASLIEDGGLEALGYLRAAQLHERPGEREDAFRYYSWFIELWGDADPQLQSEVQTARRAPDRLTAEGVAD